MTTNEDVLKASVKKFEELKRNQIMPLMEQIARTLLEDALELRSGWLGFTGNLPTSYAAAIWDFDKRPYKDIIFAQDVDGGYDMSTIVRNKIWKGQRVHLDDPWEGPPRTRQGKVPIKFQWGPDLAAWFLRDFTPSTYPCICICTGAEYSQYLELRAGANVLSETASQTFVKRVGDIVFMGAEFAARNMITR